MNEGERVLGRGRRMSVDGKLSFRRRASRVAATDLPLVDGGDDPPGLEQLIPKGCNAVEIEVGPGKGAFLIAATLARPRSFVLGIEAAGGYARIAADRLARSGHKNGLLLVDNASQFLRDRVPEASIDRLHVYFPDPWPKRRHRRRRFFTEQAPKSLRRVLKQDGLLLIATDNAAYAAQICRVIGASSLFARDQALEAELIAMPPGTAFGPTDFERKYRIEGRIIRRYAFRCR